MNDDGVDGAAYSRLTALLVLREGAQESSLHGGRVGTPNSIWALPLGPSLHRPSGQPLRLKFEKLSPLSLVLQPGAQPGESPEPGLSVPSSPPSMEMERRPSLWEMLGSRTPDLTAPRLRPPEQRWLWA